MSIDLGAYRLLSYSHAVAPRPVTPLVDVRQDARALKQALKKGQQPQPTPPLLSLAGLSHALSSLAQQISQLYHHLLGGLLPPAQPPVAQPPASQPPASQPPVSHPGQATRFVISSFNILGSNHTKPGADAAEYASGPTRIRWAAELLAQKKVDVVGFQEMNRDQVTAFKEATGDTYGIYPGNQLKDAMGSNNSIAWRKDKFELVSSRVVDFVSHKGNMWPCPVIKLRNKETGQEAYFTNFHNAPGFRPGTQQGNRDKAAAAQVVLINQLKQSGLPVIVTGDMNDQDRYYDQMKRNAGMTAANEGPNGQRPKQMGIDWIFGSPGVSFKGYQRERGALERKTSDHAMIVSQVKIG